MIKKDNKGICIAVFDKSAYDRKTIEGATNRTIKKLLRQDDCFACSYTRKEYEGFVNENSECFVDCFIRFYYN